MLEKSDGVAIETSKQSKMRRKIALLLVFSLLVSILPMNAVGVFAFDANANRAVNNALPFGGNTGSLLERNLGPAQNLRHWGGGVVVGTPESIGQLFGSYGTATTGIIPKITRLGDSDSFDNVVAAPTGNLRHIVVTPQYFANMNHPSETWDSLLTGTGWEFTSDSTLRGKRIPLLATNVVVDIKNVRMWLNRVRAGNGGAPITGTNGLEWFAGYDITTDSALVTSSNQDDSGDIGNPAGVIQAMYNSSVMLPQLVGTTVTGTTWTAYQNLMADALESSILRKAYGRGGLDDYELDNDKFVPASAASPKPMNNPTADEHYALLNQIEANYNRSAASTINRTAIRSALLDGSLADNRAVSYTAWLDTGDYSRTNGSNTDIGRIKNDAQMSVSLITHTNTRAHLLIARNFAMTDEWIRLNGDKYYFSVPIEYVTNGDTNSNSVELTFEQQGLWPQVGENNRRTVLSTVTDRRFTISLDGDPKSFHRYGRADIGGIRIAEAAQSAFDRQDWYVELELKNSGFFWATESENTTASNISARYASNNGIGNDIRPISLLQQRYVDTTDKNREPIVDDFIRQPLTGANRYSILSFPLRLEGQTNINRFVNDWFQVNTLSIAADDRAKSGNVEVEVRLYSAKPSTGTGSGNWQWHPNREQDGTKPANNVRANTLMPWPQSFTGSADMDNATWPDAKYTGPRQAGGPGDTLRYDSSDNSVRGTGLTSNGWWQWIVAPSGSDVYVRGEERNDPIYKDTLVVAKYGEIGLELFLHPDDTLPELRTGMQEWDFDTEARIGVGSTFGAVIPRTADEGFHKTARAVLRERVPGSLPATGAHPTSFIFNEGIQILGARLWTNDTAFIKEHNNKSAYVWFGENMAESDNFLNATIIGNTLTIRPEIGEINSSDRVRRYKEAEITAEFYISIMAGYEYLISEDIELTVQSGTVEAQFEEVLPVAYAWDPISLSTESIIIDDVEEAAYGVIRNVPINDVTVTETRAGSLLPGQLVWIGVEGGISRGWNNADTISIGATTAHVEGSSTMEIGPVIMDSHGAYVEIRRASNTDGAQIVFEGVQLSGRVVPDQEYSIIAAGSGIADNWSEFLWLGTGTNTGLTTRGTIHGFFPDEPYPTPAFTFVGADKYTPPGSGPSMTPPPTQATPPTVTVPPAIITQPVTISESMQSFNSIRAPGTTIPGRPLILQTSPADPSYAISYVKFSVIADLLGVEGDWNEATRSATFSNGHTTITVTNGSSMATVTGPDGMPQQVEIRTAIGSPAYPNGLVADARIIGDYFYVPISFFSVNGPAGAFPIDIRWNDGAAGFRSITVSPR